MASVPPPPPDLKDWLAGEEMTHLECRRWGHLWQHLRHELTPEPGVALRTLQRCSRCKSDRIDDMDSRGNSRKRIDHIDGYLAPKGMGRLDSDDRAQLRIETMIRITQQLEDKQRKKRGRK